MWSPLPGLVTGLILSFEGGPIYLTGLGDALVKLEPTGKWPGDRRSIRSQRLKPDSQGCRRPYTQAR